MKTLLTRKRCGERYHAASIAAKMRIPGESYATAEPG
jgi:hypothetical protein